MKRRTLLLSGAGAAGALIVGWGLLPARSRLGRPSLWPPAAGEVALNGWIKVGADGEVRLAMPRAEMGQGVHGGLALLVAEELLLAPARIALVEAGADAIYGNVAANLGLLPLHPEDTEPGRETRTARTVHWLLGKVGRELGINATGGSSSLSDAWEPLRLAAATARAQLLGAASLKWKLPVAELSIADGVISHPSGPRAHFGELAATAALTPPGPVEPLPRERWRWIGRGAPRPDIPAKVDGSARYGLDARPEGLVFAAVRQAPMFGGMPGPVDVDAVLRRPGVERVVRMPGHAGAGAAVAVVGRSTWHARQALAAMEIPWQPPPARQGPEADSRAIAASLERQAREAAAAGAGFVFHARGDAPAALQRAPRRVEALYRAPFLAHLTMEPPNCTAQLRDGTLTLWVGTQVPTSARAVAARVAGVPEARVVLNTMYLGGGFGRRLEVDFIAQAVRVALETGGRPVQLAWSREEDLAHDFYRPAGAALLQAGLDEHGELQALQITAAGDVPINRLIERTLPWLAGPLELPDKSGIEGLYDLPYEVPHQRMAQVATRHEVPVGSWRSVGHSQHAFFSEGFVDELATAAGRDPLDFRLRLLARKPRHKAVLERAAREAGWGSPLAPGRARGLALHESFGSIVAQVAEVSLDGGRPRVHRVVAAIDCGTVVDPGSVAQQMESNIVFGLTAALHGGIEIVDGVVQAKNFPDQPLLALAQCPRIETHLLASSAPPAGVGEPGLPPVAPAVANALFALTGRRRRELPLRD